MLSGISTQSFGLHQPALVDDELVYALPRHAKVLGETRLTAGYERAVFEHVPDGLPEFLGALGVAFGHAAFSDTLDTGKNEARGTLLRRAPASLLAQVEAMTDEAASYAPPGGEGEAQWSSKQQFAHLAEMETSYRAWVRKALDEEAPDLTRVIGERPAIALTQAQRYGVPALTAQLGEQRATTLALIEAMTPEQFERTASQPMFGSLTSCSGSVPTTVTTVCTAIRWPVVTPSTSRSWWFGARPAARAAHLSDAAVGASRIHTAR